MCECIKTISRAPPHFFSSFISALVVTMAAGWPHTGVSGEPLTAAAPGISSFLPWGFLSCCGSLLSHSSPCANLEWDSLTTSEYGIREINAPWFGITGRQFQGPFLCSQQDRVPIIHSYHQFINHWISFLAFLVYSLNPPPIRIMSPDEPPRVNPGFRLCFLERPRLSHRASWTLDKNAQHSHQLYQFPAF